MQQHEIAYNYAEAEYAFRKLKESSGIYLSRAKINISRGDFDSALMDVQTYLNINKHNAEAYHLLGRINRAQIMRKRLKPLRKLAAW